MIDVLAYLAVPLALYPLLVRFVLTPLIFRRLTKKHLPEELEYIRDGWTNGTEEEAVEKIIGFVRQKMRPAAPFSPDPVADGKAMALLVEKVYHPAGEELRFAFPVRRLLECGLLAFGDIMREYGNLFWVRLLSSFPLKWYRKYGRLNRSWRRLVSLPLIRRLRNLRILGPLIRLLLIPLLGIPYLILVLARGFLLVGLLEGYSRFFYSDLLLRFGYYLLYLYCGKNSLIAERAGEIDRKQIFALGKSAEEILKRVELEEITDGRYLDALERYRTLLREWNMDPDRAAEEKSGTFITVLERIVNRVLHSGKQALVRLIDPESGAVPDLRRMNELARTIGSSFYPGMEHPVRELRPGDLIETGYLAALLGYYRLYQIPGMAETLGKVRLDFAISLRDFIEDDTVRFAAKGVRSGWRAWRVSRDVRRVGRILRGAAAPASIAVHIAIPVAGQGVLDTLRSFVYHRAGRLLLHLYARSTMPRRGITIPGDPAGGGTGHE
jgi:hypothetical protein